LEVNNLPFDSLNKVVFKSGAEVVTALAGGHIDFAAQQYSESTGLILGKKIRGLAVVNPERLPAVPDVPTAKEGGYPGLNVYGWQGVSGPANLPKEVVEIIWKDEIAQAEKPDDFVIGTGEATRFRSSWMFPSIMRVSPRRIM
jgi:tripartite-type tricarboxylate transporter receptor subunit TctC